MTAESSSKRRMSAVFGSPADDRGVLGGAAGHADAQVGGVLQLFDLLALLGEHDDLQPGIGLGELHDLGPVGIHAHGSQQHVDLARHHLRDAGRDGHADELGFDAHLLGDELAYVHIVAGQITVLIEEAPGGQLRKDPDPDDAALLDVVDGLRQDGPRSEGGGAEAE